MSERSSGKPLLIIFIVMQGVFLITIVLMGLFLWPTMYRYDDLKLDSLTIPIRTHRFTDEAQIFVRNRGWVTVEPDQQDKQEQKSEPKNKPTSPTVSWLPSNELDRLESEAYITRYDTGISWFHLELYNGSSWLVYGLIVQVDVDNIEGSEKLSREFELVDSNKYATPLSNHKYQVDLGYTWPEGEMSWKVKRAWGIPIR
jgi:hypothetical protein